VYAFALASLYLPLLATADLTSGAPPPEPIQMTAELAREILRPPPGSLSLGNTNGGRLVGGVALPLDGEGFAVFPHMRERNTNWGNPGIVGAIERATRAVAERFPGSVLGVGNMGFAEGGKIPWSVSHQAGRDADLGIYALDSRGQRVDLERMLPFSEDGTAGGGRYLFDTERNLALALALVQDAEVQVQWIFIADWLKARMIDEALRQNVPGELIARLEAVLRQPSDSNPHQDHFHVRIYCTVAERLEGCRDRGPVHDWVDLGDEAYARRVAELGAIVAQIDDQRLKVAAIEKLGEVRGGGALTPLLDTLADPRRPVRGAALDAIRAIGSVDALEGLLAQIAESADGRWAGALFDAIVELDHPDTVPVALAAIADPAALLHPDAVAAATPTVLVAATRVLGVHGRHEAVPPLIALLDSPERRVRQAAHQALLRVTNQPIAGRALAGRDARARARIVEAWREFYEAHADASWLQWLRLGFEARGVRFTGRMQSPSGVERLIATITHRDRVAGDNAVRALSEITGHFVDPRWRNPRNNQRHWRSWWSKHAAEVVFE